MAPPNNGVKCSDYQRSSSNEGAKKSNEAREDVSLFDATFFNFSIDVAAAMDLQIRLLLEAVYEATENAGMPIEKLAGSNTFVFSGAYASDFYQLSITDVETLPISFLTGTGDCNAFI
ncbi:hypothetical protein HD806DRAFT_529938 [Xylariaceae sp. AK1471]|nr:hypothetical protein HD806DRAFT_529938 [Xylariaceae sp. AK1471]